MNTTSLIAEILVAGFFCLLWVILFSIAIYDIKFDEIKYLLDLLKDWSTTVLLISIAISYQLGWVILYVSNIVSHKIIMSTIRSNVFKEDEKNYNYIKNTVLANEKSSLLIKNLDKDRSLIRLTRTGFINFLFIGIALAILKLWFASFICIIISLINIFELRVVYYSFYEKILHSYNLLKKQKTG